MSGKRHLTNPSGRSWAALWPFPGFAPGAAAYFALCFLYVWLRIEPAVEYRFSGPVFSLSHSFFWPFWERPGGCVDYGAAFLAQLNHTSWLGALAFSTLACLQFLSVQRMLQRISADAPRIAPFVPTFLFLLLEDRYDRSTFAIGLGFLLAVGSALGYLLLRARLDAAAGVSRLLPEPAVLERTAGQEAPPNSPPGGPRPWTWSDWFCLLFVGLVSGMLFHMAGLWPCLLFAVFCGLLEALQRRNCWLGVGGLFASTLAPIWMIGSGAVPPVSLLNPWNGWMTLLPAVTLYASMPVTMTFAWLWQQRAHPTRVGGSKHHRESHVPQSRRWRMSRWANRSVVAGLFLLGWALVWFGFDTRHKRLAQIEYYADRREFDKLLAVAARLEWMNPASEIRLHLALYHTGRLNEDLFSYTRQRSWELLPSLGQGLDSCRAQSQTLLELGLVGEAEHLAHEALEWEGDRLDTLRLLSAINILKDRPVAARVFLNALRQIPFQGDWAQIWLHAIEADPRLPDNRELSQIRSRMLTNDVAHTDLATGPFLLQLLRANPHNQMAFEYLMAHCLLSLDMTGLLESLKRLDDFGYASIPRHCEEAILLYQDAKGTQADLGGRKIRSETLGRFQELSARLRQRANETAEGRRALAHDFGDTYWYYYLRRVNAVQASRRTNTP